MIEAGYELDALNGPDNIRWWAYVHIEGNRDQAARRGVVDRGFRFARGGRANSREEAEALLGLARGDARAEYQRWLRQPSHALAPNGALIPLDEVPAELTS